MDDLNDEDMPLSYHTTLMGFINCVLLAERHEEARRALRSEFIALGLLETLQTLRSVATEDSDLDTQVEAGGGLGGVSLWLSPRESGATPLWPSHRSFWLKLGA
jgi:hypothetical protein